MKGHTLYVRRKSRKIIENEENRGHINKKTHEDQLVHFVSSILELSLYSLSLTFLDT